MLDKMAQSGIGLPFKSTDVSEIAVSPINMANSCVGLPNDTSKESYTKSVFERDLRKVSGKVKIKK